MGISLEIRSLFFVFITVLIITGSHFSHAQQAEQAESEKDQLIKLLQLTDKELMIKQGLADTPLSEEQLKTIDEQGYIDQVTETGAVISSLGNKISCYLETRFLLGENSRYDEVNKVLLGSFYPDNKSSNIICQNFIGLPEAVQCTISENGITQPVDNDQSAGYRQLCRDQVSTLFPSSGS